MHISLVRLAALAVLALGLLGNAGAMAQQRQSGGAQKIPPAAVAVLDNQRIIRDAAAFKDARQQLDQYRATYQAEIAKEEERLRAEEQELGRQRAILAPDAFDARRREFERRFQEVQRRVQERSRALEQLFVGVRNEVGQTLIGIVKDLAAERNFNLVLDRAQVAFRAEALDITDEVLKRLDQKLPQVKVSPPTAQ